MLGWAIMPDLFERLPKYVQIKEALKKEIDIGYLKEGQKLPSELSLIDRFGASKMTVIHALQELVHEGYLRRAQGKGTFVTRPIPRMPIIGVMLPCTDKGVFHVILHAIEEQARSLGYGVLLCNVYDCPEKAHSFIKRLISAKASGLIVAPLGSKDELNRYKDCLGLLQEYDVPMVSIGTAFDEMHNVSIIQSNVAEGMSDLTKVVTQRGHRRIILICRDDDFTNAAESIQGFNHAISQNNNIDLAEIVTFSEDQSFDDRIKQLTIIINQYEPTVLMALHDHFALQLIGLLRHIASPAAERISVTGVNDLPCVEHAGLTTLRLPLYEKGRKAIDLLHEIINNNQPQSLILPCEVIIRSSLSILSD